MRRYLVSRARLRAPLVALALLAALALALGLGVAPARAAGAQGSVSGVVRNGSHAHAAVAGQTVTLQLTIGSTTKDIATTASDAQGRFSFGGLDTSASSDLGGQYAVYTTFQGGTYAAGPLNLATNPNQTATLTIYDATQDSSALSVSVATILIRQPDATHGLIGVGEFITMRNSGTTAFVGNLPSAGGSTSAMPSLLRFSLPPTAQNVTTGVGFFNTDAIQIGTGFAAAATVPPGQTEFAFAYDLPYSGTTASVPYKAEYPTAQVVTLVAPDMFVRASSGETAQGIVTAFGSRYQVFTASSLAVNGQTSVNLYDLPRPGEAQDLNTGHLIWLGLALLALLALLLALYLWRGALAVAFGLIPAATSAPAASGATSDASALAAERDRLLRDLLALERRRASGAIGEERFKREDTDLRERLRAALAAESPATTPAATPAPAPAASPATPAAPVGEAETVADGGAR
ncbi:MAG TPA: hypothetical protein VF725_10505 [Ktedonobacterales bacterium]